MASYYFLFGNAQDFEVSAVCFWFSGYFSLAVGLNKERVQENGSKMMHAQLQDNTTKALRGQIHKYNLNESHFAGVILVEVWYLCTEIYVLLKLLTRELMMETLCDCEDENIEEVCGVRSREEWERKGIRINLWGNGLSLY